MYEDDIGAVLRQALPNETPLSPGLHDRARALSRRRRLRRQLTTSGATAALLVIAGTAVALTNGPAAGGGRQTALDSGATAVGTPGRSGTHYPPDVLTPVDAPAAVAAVRNDVGSQGTLKVASQVAYGGHWLAKFTVTEPSGGDKALVLNISHATAEQITAEKVARCLALGPGQCYLVSGTTTTLPNGATAWTYGDAVTPPTETPLAAGGGQAGSDLELVNQGDSIGYVAADQTGGYILQIAVSTPGTSWPQWSGLLSKIATDPAVISAGLAVTAG